MSKKDADQLIRRIKKQGFTVRLGGRDHWRITSPSGETITAPKTPSSGNRSLANMRANLKRLGARL
ncbi:hypothetical protein [Streptomyces sp. Inha503]|uniref:hypothetical protein n=1 Tax=Streptomyces sp. Inha503 TaxID=3383314 RepID=UPI0039A1295D